MSGKKQLSDAEFKQAVGAAREALTAGSTQMESSAKVDPVEAAIKRLSAATEVLQAARRFERTARTSGDPEQMDDAVYERLKAEKEFRDATRAEAQARAARAAARRGAGAGPDGPKARGF